MLKPPKARKAKRFLPYLLDDVVSKVRVVSASRNIEELAATLLTEGAAVSDHRVPGRNEEGKFVIQKGSERWRACKHAGIETIDLVR